jgi:uncharacterized protein with HEPN domain
LTRDGVQVNAYDTVNFEIVWNVVQEDLPVLKKNLKGIVSSQPPEN